MIEQSGFLLLCMLVSMLCLSCVCTMCVRWYQCGFEPYVASHFTGVCKKVLVLRTVCVRIYVHVCELM